MAAEKTQNVQDLFLNTARKKKVPVTLFLTHGVKLQGVIGSFDNFSVVLKRGPQAQLVYKHAIASVVPGGPFSLHGDDDGGDEPMPEDMPGDLGS